MTRSCLLDTLSCRDIVWSPVIFPFISTAFFDSTWMTRHKATYAICSSKNENAEESKKCHVHCTHEETTGVQELMNHLVRRCWFVLNGY